MSKIHEDFNHVVYRCCHWKVMSSTYIGAVTCDFQLCGFLTSVDSDEPKQPHVKLRNSE